MTTTGQYQSPVEHLRPRTRNKAFQSVWMKGVVAGRKGVPEGENPYDEYDSCRGGPTFARAFHRYWDEGHKIGVEHRDELTRSMLKNSTAGGFMVL